MNSIPSLTQWVESKRWVPKRLAGQVPTVQVLDHSDHWWLVELDYEGACLQVPLAEGKEALFNGHLVKDGCADPNFLKAWLQKVAKSGGLFPSQPELVDEAYTDWMQALGGAKVLTGEQSNTSVLVPARRWPVIIKFFRVLYGGEQPEVSLPLALTKAGFEGVPQVRAISQITRNNEVITDSVASDYVHRAEDGFVFFTQAAKAGDSLSKEAFELGRISAQMHSLLERHFGSTLKDIDASNRLRASYERAAAAYPPITQINLPIADLPKLSAPVCRVHGDFHLGQTLHSATGWSIIDFEGEPLRPLSERLEPDMPERDIAGMLRSFDYARATGGASQQWEQIHRKAFLEGYSSVRQFHQEALQILEIDKALYEVAYEAQHRPTWVHVPLGGLKRLLG